MKSKLYLAVIVSVLLCSLASPVLAGAGADDPGSMYVSHIRLAWTGRSSTGTDAVVGMIFVRDGNWQRVEGAAVTVDWYLDLAGVPFFSETVLTSVQGIARSSVWRGSGVYGLRVTNVTHFDPQLSYYPTIGASALYTVW